MILTSDAPWLYHGKGLFLLSQENDQFHNVSCIKDATLLHKHAEATTNSQKRGSTKYTSRKMSLTPSLVSSQANPSNPSNGKLQETSVLWPSIAIPA